MITVLGSLNMDMVAYVPAMPQPGETIMGDAFRQVPGGKGANQAAAMARLGACVVMIGAVGTDAQGDALIQSLAKDGVDTEYIARIETAATGVALITVNHSGQNSIIVIPGANYLVTRERVDQSINAIADSNILVSQLETPMDVVAYAFKEAKRHGKRTILNPAPAAVLNSELLAATDILIPNESELETLSGIKIHSELDIRSAAQRLMDYGVKELIVTLGERGCVYICGNEYKSYPACKVKPVDTTAAGDSFIGALAATLDEGWPMDKAIKLATATGALTVTKKGAQSSLPYREEVEAFMKAEGL